MVGRNLGHTGRDARVDRICTHLDEVRPVEPGTEGCEECLALGDSWVHLRMCLSCGHVGCCDSSKNRHATGHFHHTEHPVAASHEPGETWAWCYADKIMLDVA
ncbi:UBP-type zinc finger domain-containing protein [Streptomyces antimicrobicus]|uniref:UBP-type zinc finger domain-containing protein n=1 Tax=Streptomyces antimicrobicus TaxID=2883108 RepID=A0ABS8B676_9ACTN|nr:UBP-type zinc finger domain-containing protein [Streptomyces antimicrobicus]MCB5180076.1 UBP-type zinc finger domain-containing protein [Streptomyces antimicrobicus]